MTDKVKEAAKVASKVMTEQAQAIEVNKLHATATYVTKSPFAFPSTKRFALRVIDLIAVYWSLKKDHHLCERIHAESGTPLQTPAEDYKAVRSMQRVLGDRLLEEREAHNATKAELNYKIEDLDKQVTVAVRQANMDRETIRARDEMIESILDRERLAIQFTEERVAEVKGLQSKVLDREKQVRELEVEVSNVKKELADYKKSADLEVKNAYQNANAFRDRCLMLEDGNEKIQSLIAEQKELNIKLAERCHGQHEILAGNA